MPDTFLFYDLETFGADPRRSRIAQFAAVRTDAPATMSGLSPASASACNTPMCAQPRAEPLPRARPIRGRRGVTR